MEQPQFPQAAHSSSGCCCCSASDSQHLGELCYTGEAPAAAFAPLRRASSACGGCFSVRGLENNDSPWTPRRHPADHRQHGLEQVQIQRLGHCLGDLVPGQDAGPSSSQWFRSVQLQDASSIDDCRQSQTIAQPGHPRCSRRHEPGSRHKQRRFAINWALLLGLTCLPALAVPALAQPPAFPLLPVLFQATFDCTCLHASYNARFAPRALCHPALWLTAARPWLSRARRSAYHSSRCRFQRRRQHQVAWRHRLRWCTRSQSERAAVPFAADRRNTRPRVQRVRHFDAVFGAWRVKLDDCAFIPPAISASIPRSAANTFSAHIASIMHHDVRSSPPPLLVFLNAD